MFEVPNIFVLTIVYFVEMGMILYSCSNLFVFKIQNKEIFVYNQYIILIQHSKNQLFLIVFHINTIEPRHHKILFFL